MDSEFDNLFSDEDLQFLQELDEKSQDLDLGLRFRSILQMSARKLALVHGIDSERVLLARSADVVFHRGILNICDGWHITTVSAADNVPVKFYLMTSGRLASQIVFQNGTPMIQEGLTCLALQTIDQRYSPQIIRHITQSVVVMLKMHDVYTSELRDMIETITTQQPT